MTDPVTTEVTKTEATVVASEQKATTWVSKHPYYTLAIAVICGIAVVRLLFKFL